jgi:hypothetical protein
MPLQNCHIPYLPMQALNQALLRIEHDGDAPAPPLKAAMGKKEGPGQTSMNHSVAGVPPRRRLHHEEEEDDGDFLLAYHKLDFLKFDGSSTAVPRHGQGSCN